MQTSNLETWPHGDSRRETALLGLVRVGLAEAVRIGNGHHYRLLTRGAARLVTSVNGASEAAARE